jgi:hypothetical protein
VAAKMSALKYLSRKELRKVLGADSFIQNVKGKTLAEALDFQKNLLQSICVPNDNQLLIKGAIDLIEKNILVTHIEPVYYNDEKNFGCGYIGWFMKRELVEKIPPDEDIKCYIIDAATELAIREEEKKDGFLRIDREARKAKAVTVDMTDVPPYIHLMALAYPIETVALFEKSTRDMLVDHYVCCLLYTSDAADDM